MDSNNDARQKTTSTYRMSDESDAGMSRRSVLGAVALTVASAGCSSSRAETTKKDLQVSIAKDLPSEYFESIGAPERNAAGIGIYIETTTAREGDKWPAKLSVSHHKHENPIRTNPCFTCSWKDVSSIDFPNPESSTWLSLRSGGSATFYAISDGGEILDSVELWVGPTKAPESDNIATEGERNG